MPYFCTCTCGIKIQDMKRIFDFKTALLAVFMVMGTWACQDDPEGPGEDEPGVPEEVTEEYLADGFVAVDWEQTTLNRFDTETGQVVLEAREGEMPVFEAGSSLVVDDGEEAYIRRVTGCEVEEQRVTLETVQGDMTDVFRNVSFELSGELTGRTMSRGEGGCYRFYPVSVEKVGTDGQTTRWEASRANEFLSGDAYYEASMNYTDSTLMELGLAKIWWKDCHWNIRLMPYLRFDFGETEVKDSSEVEASARKKGWLREMECRFDGSLEWALVPCFSFMEKFSAGETVVMEDVAPELRVRFVVFGIPVTLKIGTDLVAEASCEANASVDVYGGAKGKLEGQLGFRVTNDGASIKLEPVKEVEGNAAEGVPLAISAQGNAAATLAFYPRLRVKLYSVLGPSVSFYHGIEPECGWGVQKDIEARYGGIYYASRLKCSLDYEILGHEGSVGKEMAVDLWGVNLYEEPASVEFVDSGETKNRVNVGETVSATFQVNASWLEQMEQPAGEGYRVYYLTENVNEQGTPTDENGQATVEWTPREEEERLIAVVYGKDFEEVARDTADITVNGVKVAKITRRNGGGELLNDYTFRYDEEGRLMRIAAENYNTETTDYTEFTYGDGTVSVKEEYEEGEAWDSYTVSIALDEDGRATGCEVSYGESCRFSYDANGFISSVFYYYGTDGFTVEDGELTGVQREDGDVEVTPGTVANNANIDLFYFACFTDLLEHNQAFYLGLTGERFKHLPGQIANADSAEDGLTLFSYEVNEKGRVTSITKNFVDEGYSTTYNIYYEGEF